MNCRESIAQVIALVCSIIVIVLMILCLTSNTWLTADGWRQGLFSHCIEENARRPLPFNVQENEPGCYHSREKSYIQASATMGIVTLVTNTVASFLIALGLWSSDSRNKYKFYKFAAYVISLALGCLLGALVTYPLAFHSELAYGNRNVWEFGWAYGTGWGAAIFLIATIILLICDRESEEFYYKEGKVMST